MAEHCLVIIELVTAILEFAAAIIDMVSEWRLGSRSGLHRKKPGE